MTTIHFYLRYHINFGQNFFITGNIPALGNGNKTVSLAMDYFNNDYCHASIRVDELLMGIINYKYILRNADGLETIEDDNDRVLDIKKLNVKAIEVTDVWNFIGEYENTFYTKPFQETLLKFLTLNLNAVVEHVTPTHIFKVKEPLLKENETLCLLGNIAELGNWDEINPIIMVKEGNWYSSKLKFAKELAVTMYKYGVWNIDKKLFVRYENGENRILPNTGTNKGKLKIMHDGFAHLPNSSFHGAGVAIPVFSLKSKNSFGVGEFTDIKLLVDWIKSIGLKLIQLLPINDTTANKTYTDSYPYSAISAFALNPLYINLQTVAGVKYKTTLKPFLVQHAVLNALPTVDYETVMATKNEALLALYKTMKKAVLSEKAFHAFYEENKHWLLPYAAFCYLRDTNETADYNTWDYYNVYNVEAIEKLALPSAESYDGITFHMFVQYQLHLQLLQAVEYAHENGIVMKGDVPIGIYRNSCDAWVKPELYNMDTQSGAPPDDFAIKGQNWGFPTYNWKKMQEDGFAWWKQRFTQMGNYFDAFRIDHILGFFRIWSIPMSAVEGIMGKFVPCISVNVMEFSEKGIWFDYDRYCKPYITDAVIGEMFGDRYDWVKEYVVDDSGNGNYILKEHLDTQKKVEVWFNSSGNVEEWMKLKIYDLISNVILFEELGSNGKEFNFRIEMERTISFRNLDEHTQWQLKELYINYYFDRQNDFWKTQAMQKLPDLKASTNMLICGEDLGMVPDCVPGVMKDLGLLSLEIQRMPKDLSHKFFNPANAPYLSVVTPSTHDMSTIRGWWEEDRASTQQFYNLELGRYGDAPYYCEPWINKEIVAQHLHSPAMWSIFQLQDLMGIDGDIRREKPNDERINIPADPHHYWRYRMHISLEDLMNIEGFNTTLKAMLLESGR